MKCDICGKIPQFGHNVSHSKRHTARTWQPNVHPAIVIRNGANVRMHLCTRCMRNETKVAKTA